MKICTGELTTCDIVDGGQAVRLDFVDAAGVPVSLQMPFDQAQAIVMTLPRMLARAVKSLTGSADARYVFPLGNWAVEKAKEQGALMLTLATPDGFEVSFGVSPAVSHALGKVLAGRHDDLGDAESDDVPHVVTVLN